MEITQDRLKHSVGVARKLYEMSLQRGWDVEKAKNMFVLGFVHDIGYEFAETQSEHADVGAVILEKCGFQYSNEVMYHGKVQKDYSSEELNMLNVADFLVGPDGQSVTVQERLDGISQRYGENSKQYMEAKMLAKQLGLQFTRK